MVGLSDLREVMDFSVGNLVIFKKDANIDYADYLHTHCAHNFHINAFQDFI